MVKFSLVNKDKNRCFENHTNEVLLESCYLCMVIINDLKNLPKMLFSIVSSIKKNIMCRTKYVLYFIVPALLQFHIIFVVHVLSSYLNLRARL